MNSATEYLNRENEIAQAKEAYPGMEIGEAYKKWKERRGEKPEYLSTRNEHMLDAKKVMLRTFRRKCTSEGCPGKQVLEGICPGCVESKKGRYKTKWTCEEDPNHRELSSKTYREWVQELERDG